MPDPGGSERGSPIAHPEGHMLDLPALLLVDTGVFRAEPDKLPVNVQAQPPAVAVGGQPDVAAFGAGGRLGDFRRHRAFESMFAPFALRSVATPNGESAGARACVLRQAPPARRTRRGRRALTGAARRPPRSVRLPRGGPLRCAPLVPRNPLTASRSLRLAARPVQSGACLCRSVTPSR